MSQLDDIEARLNAAAPGAITITPSDIHYLRTLARKQADALERVEALADSFDGLGSHASYHGTEAEMETWLSAANHLRAALEPKP